MASNSDTGIVELGLNKKALNFIVAALDLQLRQMDAALSSGTLSDDEQSEIGNDRDYLRGLREMLAERARGRPSNG